MASRCVRLTIEEDRETLKRYGHITPARGWRTSVCSTRCAGTVHHCTLVRGHRGPHVAHGFFKKVVAVWDAGSEEPSSMKTVRRRPVARASTDFRTSARILESLLGRLRLISSRGEEIALLILFLAFVVFAIDWVLLILG